MGPAFAASLKHTRLCRVVNADEGLGGTSGEHRQSQRCHPVHYPKALGESRSISAGNRLRDSLLSGCRQRILHGSQGPGRAKSAHRRAGRTLGIACGAFSGGSASARSWRHPIGIISQPERSSVASPCPAAGATAGSRTKRRGALGPALPSTGVVMNWPPAVQAERGA